MTDLLEPRAMGQSLVRRDGVDKVRGTAVYACETPVEQPAYAYPVQATIARGRVTAMDTAAAEALDGVLTVLTPFTAERLADTCGREYAVLQSPEVAFRGQLIGVVVAETSELAREVADSIQVTYHEQPHDSELHTDRPDLGGFNWASQHLKITEVCGGTRLEADAGGASGGAAAVGGGSGVAAADAFPGPAGAFSCGPAGLLAADRIGDDDAPGRDGRRGVLAGGVAVVPARWRNAAAEPGRAIGPVPVLR